MSTEIQELKNEIIDLKQKILTMKEDIGIIKRVILSYSDEDEILSEEEIKEVRRVKSLVEQGKYDEFISVDEL
ncbi:MAG: hypothetical protein ACE5J9_09475 [Methanosarcinales archaeon]